MNDSFKKAFEELKEKESTEEISGLINILEKKHNRTFNDGFEINKDFIDINKSVISDEDKKLIDFLYKLFLKQPYTMFDFKAFDEDNLEYIFNEEQIKRINDFRRKAKIRYVVFINSIKDGTKLSDNYLRYAISIIGKNDILTEKTYKYLLNNIKYNNTLFAYEFIAKYTSYLACKELNIDYADIYLSNWNFINNRFMDCPGKFFPLYRMVIINKDSFGFTDADLLYFIKSVCHEIKHIEQFDRCLKDNISNESFYWLTQRLFNQYESNQEYKKNYSNYELEYDANEFGWNFTNKIFSKYTNKTNLIKESLIMKNEVKLNRLNNFKYGDGSQDIMEDVDYNVETYDKIMRKHPELTKPCRLLEIIYNIDGKRKPMFDLTYTEDRLVNKNKERYKELSDVLRMFYIHDINKGIDVDLSKKDRLKSEIFILKLLSIAEEEVKDIINSVELDKVCLSNNHYRINKKTKLRIIRIKKILDYLIKNYRTIQILDSRLIYIKISKLVNLLDKLNIKIDNNFMNKIFYTKNTYAIQQSGYKLKKLTSK